LNDINLLFKYKNFQSALIEYIHHALSRPIMSDAVALNIRLAHIRLHRHLSELARKQYTNTSAVDSTEEGNLAVHIAPVWSFSDNKSNLQDCAWWRIDYVVESRASNLFAPSGRLSIPVFKVEGNVVKIQTDFTVAVPGSAIFKVSSFGDYEDFYEGIQTVGPVVIAFVFCRIEQDRIFSQLIAELYKESALNINKMLANINSISAHNSPLEEENIRAYLEKLGLNNESPIGDPMRLYFDSAALDLKNSVATYFRKTIRANLQPCLKLDTLKLVEHKSQLGDGVSFHIEGVKHVARTRVVHGWIVDPCQVVKHIHLLHPNVPQGIELFQNAVKFDRADIATTFGNIRPSLTTHYGFVSVANEHNLPEHSHDVEILVTLKNGIQYRETILEEAVAMDDNGLQYLIGILTDDKIDGERCERFFKPVFRAFTHNKPIVKLFFNKVYGSRATCSKPRLSVIIPLYGNIRFEQTQIPLLAALRQLDWEVIFAVDDLRILDTVCCNVERLALLYGLPVRVLAPDRNLGFSGINNFAVAHCHGQYVLFLNSDCFVTRTAPVLAALKWLEDRNGAGAAGFRLLYANQTIQHDGMSVGMWDQQREFYLNEHPRIGVAAPLAPKHPVNDNAVMLTAACLCMSRLQFNKVGGFSRSYLRGDFEDSDLCLKILTGGGVLGIVREHGIYHLERQSIGSQHVGLRQTITLVNSYIYSKRWATTLGREIIPLKVI